MPDPDDLAVLRRCLVLVQEQEEEHRPLLATAEAAGVQLSGTLLEFDQRCWERLEQLVQQAIDGCVESARDKGPF